MIQLIPSAHRQELRALLWLSGPIILANIASMSMQLIDTILVGPLGAESLAGVGLGSAVISGVGYPLSCLLLGLDAEIGKAVGANDETKIRSLLAQMLLLCGGIALIQVALILLVASHLESFGVQPSLVPLAQRYLYATATGMLFFNFSFAGAKFLQAKARTRPAVIIAVFGNLINAGLVYLLTYGRFGLPELGVTGTGIATAVARAVMATCYLALFYQELRPHGGLRALRFDRSLSSSLLRLGAPAAGQVFLEVGLFVGATFMVARFDAAWVAAHQIVLQTATLTFMFPMGMSVAAAVRVGMALGAKQFAEARLRGTVAWRAGALVMAAFSLLLITLARPAVGLFNQDPSVLAHVAALIGYAAAFQLFDGVQVTLTGVLRGFGDTRSPFFANLLGHWLIALPVALFLAFSSTLAMGPEGIWAGLAIGLTAVAALLSLRWRAVLAEQESAPK